MYTFFLQKVVCSLENIYIYILQNGMFSELIILQIEEKKIGKFVGEKIYIFSEMNEL